MTYASLRAALRALCSDTYRRAAPHGLTRYIVVHKYPGSVIRGYDSAVKRLPRVHIDVYWQAEDDALPDLVCQLLDALGQAYDWIDEIYDDDFALCRLILQTEVTG